MTKAKHTIYLAGASFETEYRAICEERYGSVFNLIDPMKHEFKMIDGSGLERDPKTMRVKNPTKELISNIVEIDKDKINKSCFLVAYVQQPTFGTVMEISYAYERGMPVFVINPNGKWKKDVWLSYHCDFQIFDSIDECFEFIIDTFV
jgi:nucleoside 2-deoxyribosyltransferase